jgi:hypothetical protein
MSDHDEQCEAEMRMNEITEYLSVGGLTNPELMEHDKVRDLLIHCRSSFRKLQARLAELEAERDDYRKRWEDTSCTRHHAMETAIKLYEAKRTRVAQLEKAMIAYLSTEGCSCCQDVEGHRAALDQIAKVFGWPQFDDGSGIDWYSRRDELENNDE